MTRLAAILALTAAGCGAGFAQGSDLDISGHTKYRLTYTTFPDDSLFRSLTGSSAEDLAFDARLNVDWASGNWSFQSDAQFAVLYGDTIEYTREFSDELNILFPRLPNDDRRLFDLTHIVTDEGKRASLARLDRLFVGYTGERAVLNFGRQAVTWGNGLMFNTVMDIFNPFDPTAVDKEYKSGDDMLYGQYLRDSGDDVQAVLVFRRNPLTGELESDQSSLAVKYHGFLGGGEYDLIAARHFGETLVGVGATRGIGGALWRGDLSVTLTDRDGAVASAVTNISQSLIWAGKNVSAVAEYYFNGFGQRSGSYSPADLASNPELVRRLARGELFNLGRHYVGLSATIELTPLFLITPNLFMNVEDPSAIVQIATQTDLSSNMLLLGALNIPVGEAGTEYGGIDTEIPGVQLATGPGIFVQLAWYF